MTVALVTGATGNDGSYLCEQLVGEGVEIHAVVEDAATAAPLPWLIGTQPHPLDLRDGATLRALVARTAPDEVYNLAGLSSVARSWQEPVLTAKVNAVPVAELLQACRVLQERRGTPVRVVQASSAEIFGAAATWPQDERTPVAPTNPYGAAKAYAHHLVGVHRKLLHPDQRRVPTTPAHLCHPQDNQGCGAHRPRGARPPGAGQPRRTARLGVDP